MRSPTDAAAHWIPAFARDDDGVARQDAYPSHQFAACNFRALGP